MLGTLLSDAKSNPIQFCCHLKLNNVVTEFWHSFQLDLCCMHFFIIPELLPGKATY